LGQVSYDGAGTRGAPATAFTINQTLKLKAWNVTAVGTFPINDAFSVLGKFGLTRMDSTNATTLPAANSVSAHTIKTGVAYGAGVKFDLNKDVMLRADFDNYDTGIATGRISAWTVGVGYRF
jgi:opacity protein-like surface antigen